jgi:hypothetical protein
MSDGVKVESKESFLPDRYIAHDLEVLGRRIVSVDEAAGYAGLNPNVKPGDWVVTDPRGKQEVLTHEDFMFKYKQTNMGAPVGKIAVQLDTNKTAFGCKAMFLADDRRLKDDNFEGELLRVADLLNEFFAQPENFGKALIHITIHDEYSATIMYHNTLSERDRQEMGEVSQGIREELDKKHREALAAQAEAITRATAAEAKARKDAQEKVKYLEKMAAIGERHEKNCKKGKK